MRSLGATQALLVLLALVKNGLAIGRGSLCSRADSRVGAVTAMVRRTTVTSELTRWVGATIFSVCDTEVGVFRLVLDPVNSLDRVRNIGEVDESAVPE